jgi:hypothetical protein
LPLNWGQFPRLQGHACFLETATTSSVAVEIKGSSLGEVFDRWLVFYDDVRQPVTPDLIGKLCVVGLSDDRVLIKTLERGRNGRFNLKSNTEPVIQDAEVRWAAPVIDMKPR